MRAFHDSRNAEYRAPYGALVLGDAVELTLDVWDAPDVSAMLRTWVDGVGETRYPMDVVEQTSTGDQRKRFHITLEPEAAGTVWYQFVIAHPEGWETRYGAQDGKLGGEGRLCNWEPPSFKLSVYDPKELEGEALRNEANLRYREMLVRFLRNESSAPAFVEALEELREDCPGHVFERALDVVGSPDRAHLLAQLVGAADAQSEHHGDIAAYQIDAGNLGLAKGRLWCASLIQALLPRRLHIATRKAVEQWGTLDSDCGTIVQNALDLRQALPLFQESDPALFAANDSVLGFWRDGANGEYACVLVNASLHNAHDILIPMRTDAVSEVISGYAVAVVDAAKIETRPAYAPAVERYARVHLSQLGSAVPHFHAEHRLEKPLDAGMGVLAHITSLPADEEEPTPGKLGTMGSQARAFVDWLANAGVRYWQVLPVNPTDGFGSPYAGISAFAGNTLLLPAEQEPAEQAAYEEFCEREAEWLEPYAAFMAIRQKLGEGECWQSWPKEFRAYDPALVESDEELSAYAEDWRLVQFAFEAQWKALRAYANERGVQIIGDMPIYVSADSADAWANPGLFQLGADGRPQMVAGCPPDAFAVEGQVWGNPLYDWEALRESGYDWWLRRLKRVFDLYDVVRLDHFIGFARYYAIPAGKKAAEGSYHPGPGLDFFNAAYDAFGPLPIIAEDLGLITPAVRALVSACGFPGMDVVQFVDGGDPLAGYWPRPNKVAYTGTHDNQTLVGYAAARYPGLDAHETADQLMEKVLASNARICVVPLQDVLGLGDEARMNTPGTSEDNWKWQAEAAAIEEATPRLREIVALHNR